MPVVQLPFMYEVYVVAVRDALITVGLVIPRASRLCAVCRILGAHRQVMFVIVVAVQRVKMSVMQVICMPLVTNGGVSAVRAMFMRVALMRLAVHFSPFLGRIEKGLNYLLGWKSHRIVSYQQPDKAVSAGRLQGRQPLHTRHGY
jgi:hypothetical protein